MRTGDRPIGWWLKRADELITADLDRTLAGHELDRSGWQVLNLLAGRPTVRRDDLYEPLAPFLAHDEVDAIAESFAARGWLSGTAFDSLALTPEGRSAHAEIADRVAQRRAAVTEGVSADDYARAIATLQRMVANLEGE